MTHNSISLEDRERFNKKLSIPTMQEFAKSLKKDKSVKFNVRSARAAHAGMKAILDMHDDEEMNKLCEDLGILMHESASKAERTTKIFDVELQGMEGFRRVLTHVWDGIILEHLRRTARRGKERQISTLTDPRVYLLRQWTNDSSFSVKGFGRHDVPCTTRRSDIEAWRRRGDETVLSALLGLREREKTIKALETQVRRGGRDYRNALLMFREVGQLRVDEETLRRHLLKQLEENRTTFKDAVADLRVTQDEYHRELAAHLNAVSAHVRGQERDRILRELYEELACGAEAQSRFDDACQRRLSLDAFSGQAEIDRLRRALKVQRRMSNWIEMRREDHAGPGGQTERARAHRARCGRAVRARLGSELEMAHRELQVLQATLFREKRQFDAYRSACAAEGERAAMEIEEWDQRFGKKRPRKRKKGRKGRRGGKKAGGAMRAAAAAAKLKARTAKGRRQKGK
jgi:hypothetical protein